VIYQFHLHSIKKLISSSLNLKNKCLNRKNLRAELVDIIRPQSPLGAAFTSNSGNEVVQLTRL
jgi:hypothetical protein